MPGPFPEKRTRSQLTLTHDLFQLPLDRSPLKNARTRMQSEPPKSLADDGPLDNSDVSDDELLLSPTTKTTMKRAAPQGNDYLSNQPDFPASKRLKTVDDPEDVNRDQAMPLSTLDNTTLSPRKGTATPSKYRRSMSVPAFPMIDLRNPPSSPNKRQGSRSPSRRSPDLIFTPLNTQEPTFSTPHNTLAPLRIPPLPSGLDDDELSPLTEAPDSDYAMDVDVLPRKTLPSSPKTTAPAKPSNPPPTRTRKPPAPRTAAPPKPKKSQQPKDASQPKKNAFEVMMASSVKSKSKGKGKAKEEEKVSAIIQAAPAPAPSTKSPLSSRPSLKSRMKPKGRLSAKSRLPPRPPSPVAPDFTDTPLFSEPEAMPESSALSPHPVHTAEPESLTSNPTAVSEEVATEPVDCDVAGDPFVDEPPPSSSPQLAVDDVPPEQITGQLIPHEEPDPHVPELPVEKNVSSASDTVELPQALEDKVDVPMDILTQLPSEEPASNPVEKDDKQPALDNTPPETEMDTIMDDTQVPKPHVAADVQQPTQDSGQQPLDEHPVSNGQPPLQPEQDTAVQPSPPTGMTPSDSKKTLKGGANSKKRPTASNIPRVTRNTLKKKEQAAEQAGQAPRIAQARKQATTKAKVPLSKAAKTKRPTTPPQPEASTSQVAPQAFPKTPAKLPSFARPTLASLAKTPGPRSPTKTYGSPSKLPRPSATASKFEFPAGGIFSQLSEFLETAETPAHTNGSSSRMSLHRSKTFDVGALGQAAPSTTPSNSNSTASSSKVTTTKAGQSSLGDFFQKKPAIMSGRGGKVFPNKGSAPKASQKTPLPTVAGSPVKGGDRLAQEVEDDDDTGATRQTLEELAAKTDDMELKGILRGSLQKWQRQEEAPADKTDEEDASQHDYRRASTALGHIRDHQTMGPPATPPRRGGLRSASSTFPSTSAAGGSQRPQSAMASYGSAGMNGDDDEGDDEDEDMEDAVEDGNYRGGAKKTSKPTGLTVLAGVKAYLDIKDGETGDDCSAPFAEMLTGLGAKVLAKFGPTCTHLVFKDGTFRTHATWKKLEKQPLVVRISWIVKCAEMKQRVDETDHLNDISDMFRSGVDTTKKRPRKSRIPLPKSGPMDMSFDESDISMDDPDASLPPLMRAYTRRQSGNKP